MGKKIIVNGADFSENGVEYKETMYLHTYTDYGGGANKPTAANGGWAFGNVSAPYSGLVNKTINFVRFKSKQAGILNFYRCTDPTDSTTRQLITSVNIPATNQEITHVFEAVTLGNEYFIIGEANGAQGLPGFDGNGGGVGNWMGKVPSASPSAYNGGGIRIDVGFVGY